MTKIKIFVLFAFLFLFLPHSAKAQVPTFDCSKSIQVYTDVTTGNVYSCKITAGVGTWMLAGGGGGAFGPNFVAGGGTAQAQTVAPTTAVTNVTLVNGYQICWLPIAANTGAAPTLAGSGTSTFSAKPITKYGTVALVANDITTAGIACVIYDGTEFQLQVPLAGGVFTGSLSTGSGASACGAALGCIATVEASTAGTPTAGQDYCRPDSVLHTYVCSVNGVAEAPEILGTCATANALSLFTAASTVGCGLADFTYASHTLTGAAAGLADFSAETGADGFKIPYNATAHTANGAIRVDSGTGGLAWRGQSSNLFAAATGNSSQTSTTCTNQVVTALSTNAAPTCTSLTNSFLPASITATAALSGATHLTATNCSSSASPAVCGSAAAGSVAVPTGVTPTLVVNTTAVTANSQILFTPDESLGTKLSVTCNSTIAQVAIEPIVTARTAATSFTIQYNTTITVNPICLSYFIVN